MADGQFPTLISKDQDVNAQTNPIFTQLTDGTNAATITGSSLNVNITGGATSGTQYAEDSAAVSGDLGNVALVVRKDAIGSNVGADGDYATLLQDANGRLYTQIHDGGNSITVDGTVAVSSVAGTVTVSATDLDIRDLAFATDKVDVTGSSVTVTQATGSNLHAVLDAGSAVIGHVIADSGSTTVVTGNVTVVQPTGTNLHTVIDSGAVTVSATDLDIRDLNLTQDAVKVSGNSSANSASNPIFVAVTNPILTGEVNSYSTATIAAAATSNHDYTVTTAMKLKSVAFACSGSMKIEIQVGPVASLVTKAVGFISSNGGNNVITFDPPIEIPTTSTGTVRVIRTNRNNQTTDVYSTILGIDA